MRRRAFLFSIACGVAAAPTTVSAQPGAAARERELDAWWARQREKEEADRFWNGPRERRRNLTRDQIDRWEAQRNYRGQGPTGLATPYVPYYSPYRRFW